MIERYYIQRQPVSLGEFGKPYAILDSAVQEHGEDRYVIKGLSRFDAEDHCEQLNRHERDVMRLSRDLEITVANARMLADLLLKTGGGA